MLRTERHLADLPPKILARIARMGYNILLEKHEEFPYCFSGDPTDLPRSGHTDLVRIGDDAVLLPTHPENLEHISILHAYTSADRAHLTVVLQDLRWPHEYPGIAEYELPCYFVALCERVAEGVCVTVFYHETNHPYTTTNTTQPGLEWGPRTGQRSSAKRPQAAALLEQLVCQVGAPLTTRRPLIMMVPDSQRFRPRHTRPPTGHTAHSHQRSSLAPNGHGGSGCGHLATPGEWPRTAAGTTGDDAPHDRTGGVAVPQATHRQPEGLLIVVQVARNTPQRDMNYANYHPIAVLRGLPTDRSWETEDLRGATL